jgi:tRNA pseudouridine38-40 synthase
VQGEIEKAIFKFSGEKKTIQGAGRTDAGVHALAQCANFELEKKFDEYQILNGINFHLGTEKIRITKVENVGQEFNARFTAKSKIYNYQVFNSQAPSVIEDDFSIHIRQPLDIDSMQNAVKLFLGKHDFSSFRAQGCQANKPLRTIDDASIEVKGKKIIFTFKAQSFLYQQIRIMVGSLLEVGLKNKNINWIKELIEAKDRSLAGPTVPSKGLILKEISY